MFQLVTLTVICWERGTLVPKQNGLAHLYCLFLLTMFLVKKKLATWLAHSEILFLCQALPANGSHFQHATWQSKSVGLCWRYVFCFLNACFCLFFMFYIFVSVCLSVRPSVHFSVCLSASLPVCLCDSDFSQKWLISFQILCLQWSVCHSSKVVTVDFFRTFVSSVLGGSAHNCPQNVFDVL